MDPCGAESPSLSESRASAPWLLASFPPHRPSRGTDVFRDCVDLNWREGAHTSIFWNPGKAPMHNTALTQAHGQDSGSGKRFRGSSGKAWSGARRWPHASHARPFLICRHGAEPRLQAPLRTLSYPFLKSVSTQACQAGSGRTSSTPRVHSWKWLEHASVLGFEAALSPYPSFHWGKPFGHAGGC